MGVLCFLQVWVLSVNHAHTQQHLSLSVCHFVLVMFGVALVMCNVSCVLCCVNRALDAMVTFIYL